MNHKRGFEMVMRGQRLKVMVPTDLYVSKKKDSKKQASTFPKKSFKGEEES